MRGRVARELRRQTFVLAQRQGFTGSDYQDVVVRRGPGTLRKLRSQRQRRVDQLSAVVGEAAAERLVPPISRTAVIRRCTGMRAGYQVLKSTYKQRRSTP